MGGMGSGTWSRNSKNTVEQYHAIDIRTLCKKGRLQPGDSGEIKYSMGGTPTGVIYYRALDEELGLIYGYRSGDTWLTVGETLYFDYSDCHFEGVRQWFSCPRCWSRVAVLYAGHFACRKCLNLVYESQRENPLIRSIRRSKKAVGKLGDMTNGIPGRPKGMHRETYYRLLREAHYQNQEIGLMVNAWRSKL